MISEKEANNLMTTLVTLKQKFTENPNPITKRQIQRHEQLCMTKLNYLIEIKTAKYKPFPNYEDLNQDGYEALVMAMKTYNPQKGSFFSWAHKYIKTRVARSANLHSTIRYPLKYAKENQPYKEIEMPMQLDENYNPEEKCTNDECFVQLKKAFAKLTDLQQQIISLYYGFKDDNPITIAKICEQVNVPRKDCIRTIRFSHKLLKDNIKI